MKREKIVQVYKAKISPAVVTCLGAVLALVLLCMSGCAPPPVVIEDAPAALQRDWNQIPGWEDDNPAAALEAFQRSCSALRYQKEWRGVCVRAVALTDDPAAIRTFFEDNFTPWQLQNTDGSKEGTITGYYVPDIDARREPDSIYRYPIFSRPEDMLVIDMSEIYPELGKYRLRGRVEDGRVLPYWDRAAIEAEPELMDADPLFWVRDPVELFFLHIQGSGRVNLADGSKVMINYADQNGHPYRSIGKLLLERNEMTPSQMSMQNIARWGRENPHEIDKLLNENPSYVFFTSQSMASQTPPGAQGVPLTSRRSLAVDRSYVPLGAPVFIDTRWPREDRPLRRLMVAQDTGGAIKGRVRGDFFWGVGDEAGWQAGAMKYPGRMWMLLPNGITPAEI